MAYRVKMNFMNGGEMFLEESFDTYEEAQEAAEEACSDYYAGGYAMDPDDYDSSDDYAEYKIIKSRK